MKKLTPSQLFAMLICTRAFSMMTFLPESTANALELMLGTVLSTVFSDSYDMRYGGFPQALS